MNKVICVIGGAFSSVPPSIDGLRGYHLLLPTDDVPSEHPDDVTGIASVWLDEDAPIEPSTWFPDTKVDAYHVLERVKVDYDRDWPDGQVSPGLHRMVFVRRAPGLTRDQMAHHWSERHAPLVPEHHPAFWRYVQNVVIQPVTPDTPEVDGIAQMQFRSAEDMRDRFYASDASKQLIGEDVARFLDRAGGWRMLGKEHWIVTPSTNTRLDRG